MTSTGPAPRADVAGAVELLSSLGTFAGATEEQLQRLVEAGYVVTVPQGWSLIWDRTPADKAYVVLRGEVEVRRDGQAIARLGAGDVIGELAILRRQLRSATVVAATPLTVLHFGREAVERLYAEVPVFRDALDRAAGEHTVAPG
ncbi:cyclic nucleotide-binding domain-containing protein [Marmoricola sp. URHA0025 HA25]